MTAKPVCFQTYARNAGIQNCMENDKENQINEYYMYKDPCFLDNIKKYVLELITEHEQHCKYE